MKPKSSSLLSDDRPVMVDCQEPRGRHPQRVVVFTAHGFCIMRRQADGKLSMSTAAVTLPAEMAEEILKVVRRQNVSK